MLILIVLCGIVFILWMFVVMARLTVSVYCFCFVGVCVVLYIVLLGLLLGFWYLGCWNWWCCGGTCCWLKLLFTVSCAFT